MDISEKIYDAFMVPLERTALETRRKKLIPRARGDVLEVGTGTGANLPWYDYSSLQRLVLTDRAMNQDILKKKLHSLNGKTLNTEISFLEADAEKLPFPAEHFDTVVFTLIFCSVADPPKGLSEVKRVLKPGGYVLFLEHVLSDRAIIAGPQHAVTPVWKRLAGGCHLNRETGKLISEAGFRLEELERFGGGAVIAGVARKE